ncbi:MAG: hypothetical protein AMXMBFR68_06750 [Ignavibacteria bacterium]
MNRILLRLCAVALCVGGLVLPDTATAGLKLSRDVILTPASTEMPQYIGVYGGLAMNYHSGTFSLTDGNTVCCTFTDGDGLGFVGGVKGFFSVIENLYYSPRLALEGRGGTLNGNQYQDNIRGAFNKIEPATFRNDFEVSLPTLNLDLLACYVLVPDIGLYLAGGASVGYVMSTDYTQSENIIAPTDITYAGTTSRSRVIATASVADFNSVQIGVRFGVGALLPLTDGIALNPEVLYHLPMLAYADANNATWKSSILLPTLGFLITL